jgi:predicted ATPase/DNA-binding SARP family transcriptional activator
MEFRVLGTVEVVGVDGPLALGGPNQRRLLAALLAGRRHVVSTDTLSAALWGEEPPATARSTLQTSVSKLRRVLGGHRGTTLDNRPPGYVLDVPPSAVDADRFDGDVLHARALARERPLEAIEILDRALATWAGDAFAEFAELPWAITESVRLGEVRLQAMEIRNDARLSIGDADAVVAELEGLVAAQPLRERFWTQLMLGLHRSGRQAEALRVGATFRRHLRDELGLDPSPSFLSTESAVLESGSGAATRPHGPRPDRPQGSGGVTSLPTPTAPLVGREALLEQLEAAVSSSRVVTLTGPGGVGKSSLAIEVARRVSHDRPGGVRLVELAPISDPSAVVAAVAQGVDAERRSGRSLTEAILEVLSTRSVLLVIDNCEHVISPLAELVAEIVRWCPTVTVLATSREPIGMAGELVRPVGPLEVPSDPDAPIEELADVAAVEVFVARAIESSPGFALDPTCAPAVAELCIRLDGLPLALELAAARMSSMSPHQLLGRLDERFALLGSGHGRVERHRALLDVVQWSYTLLDADEQLLFDRLSVFAGGFDLDAAERTCGDRHMGSERVAPLLAGLVDKSLVAANVDTDGVRFRMLETLRQFGADRLAARSGARRVRWSHRDTFVARAVLGGEALEDERERRWAPLLERDMDNLRAALSTAVATDDADAALQIVVGVRESGFRSIRYEVVDWAETVADMAAAHDHPLRPSALAIVAYGAFVRGELPRAVALAEDSLDMRRRLSAEPCGLAERVLGNALFYMGQADVAVEWISRLAELARDAAREGRLAHALYMHSVARTSVGDAEAGAELAARATVVAAGCGSPTALSQAAYASGLAVARSDPDGAILLLDESAALASSVGNRWMQSFARTEASWLRARRGESETALLGFREVVGTWFRGGDWANQWLSLRYLAGILADHGLDEEAVLLSGAVEAAGAASALPCAPVDVDGLTRLSVELEARIGEEQLARGKRRGALMHDEAAVTLALGAIERLLDGHPG